MSNFNAGLWVQISSDFMETNCPAFIYILNLFKDILGDLTRLFYLLCCHYSKVSQVAKKLELCNMTICK